MSPQEVCAKVYLIDKAIINEILTVNMSLYEVVNYDIKRFYPIIFNISKLIILFQTS